MASFRYHVDPRDAPAAVAARRIGLTEAEFKEKLPELLARGFPHADKTTGLFDLDAIDVWRRARHPHLFVDAHRSMAKDARLVVPERLKGDWLPNGSRKKRDEP